VLLLAYEWRRAGDTTAPERVEMAGTDWAPAIEVERLGDHWEERLEAAGFFFPAHKVASMKLNFRNFWSRMPLTRADVQLLHGALRQLVRRRDAGPPDAGG
jgi:tRNA/rRNA methyltransferase